MATAYGGYLNQYYTKPSFTSSTYNQRTVSAPTVASAPTTVNYSGPAGYSGYVNQNTNSMYGDYLRKQYEDPTKLATNSQGQTAYDLQRAKVTSDVEAERARQQEALDRKLSAQGLSDSGVAYKQRRMLAKDLGTYGGQQKSNIGIEELQAQQAQAERLGSQAFEAEQTALQRAEAQRQFDADQNLRVSLQNNSNAMTAWTQGNKQAFDTWVEQNNINKQDADRFWEASQNERSIESNLSQALAERDFGDYIDQRAEGRKNKTSYYFTAGQAGSLSEEELASLQQNDQDAYYAYKAGQEGKTVEQATSDNEFRNSIRDSLIVNADDPKMVSTLLEIAKANNLDVGNWETPTGGTSGTQTDGVKLQTDSREYTIRLKDSSPLSTSVSYKSGGGVDNGWYFDSPPAKGSDFSYNGKLYRRTDDDVQRDQSGPNKYETEYIMVEDVETGELLRLDAKAMSGNAHVRKSHGGNTFPVGDIEGEVSGVERYNRLTYGKQ